MCVLVIKMIRAICLMIKISEEDTPEMLSYAAEVVQWLHDRLRNDSETKWGQVYLSNVSKASEGQMTFSVSDSQIIEYRDKLIAASKVFPDE